MPNLAKWLNLACFFSLAMWPYLTLAADFSARILSANLEETQYNFSLTTEINYQLSPIAREALQKGVPLSWNVLFKISRQDLLYKTLIYEKSLNYTLQFHALLNQYEVKSPGQLDMFLSLNAALNFMSQLHQALSINKNLFSKDKQYEFGVKTQFNREFLPVPLRPFAYIDMDWSLSSDWYLWSIQK